MGFNLGFKGLINFFPLCVTELKVTEAFVVKKTEVLFEKTFLFKHYYSEFCF